MKITSPSEEEWNNVLKGSGRSGIFQFATAHWMKYGIESPAHSGSKYFATRKHSLLYCWPQLMLVTNF